MKCITSLVLFLIAPVGLAQGVPNTFTAGTPARAAEVNENSTDLDTRLTTSENIVSQLFAEFDFLYIENTSATGVVTSLCPVDTIGISANCQCDGDGTTSNFGVLFGCYIFPDGTLGGCYDQAGLFNPGLPHSPVSATAVCVSAILVDETIASTFIAAGSSPMQKISPSAETIEEVVVRYENQISAMRNARLLKQ